MAANELFALIFIFTAVLSVPIALFLELGGLDIVAIKLVEFIDSYIAQEDI